MHEGKLDSCLIITQSKSSAQAKISFQTVEIPDEKSDMNNQVFYLLLWHVLGKGIRTDNPCDALVRQDSTYKKDQTLGDFLL